MRSASKSVISLLVGHRDRSQADRERRRARRQILSGLFGAENAGLGQHHAAPSPDDVVGHAVGREPRLERSAKTTNRISAVRPTRSATSCRSRSRHRRTRVWTYNGGGTDLLGNILERVSGKPLEAFAREVLFEPLGITDWEWMNYRNGKIAPAAGLRLRPRDAAKIGQLVLNAARGTAGRSSRPNGSSNRSRRASRRSAISAGCSFTASNGGWAARCRGDKEVKWIAAMGLGRPAPLHRARPRPRRDDDIRALFQPAPGPRGARHAGELHHSRPCATTTRDNKPGKTMSLKFTVGDLTIHRIIEQETTFLPALEMLPGLTPEAAGGEPGVDAKGRRARRQRRADPVLPVLRREDAAPHHPDRQLHRQRQAAAAASEMEHEDRRHLHARAGRRRLFRRRHRLRDVHASACRPCRLEHAAGKRPLGADLSERALRVRQDRVRLLDRKARQDAGAAVRRQRAAGRRGQAGRDRARRLRRSATTRASCRRRATRPAMSPSPSAAARTTPCSRAT